MEPTTYDFLSMKADPALKSLIKEEKLLFSDKIIKINRYNMSQDRNIIITDKGIYNLKKKSLKRRIPLGIIFGVTLSKITDELVIHGQEAEYDYHYVSQRRRKIIEVLSKAYFDVKKVKMRFSEVNEKSLTNFVTLKKEKKKNPSFTRMISSKGDDIDTYLSHANESTAKEPSHPVLPGAKLTTIGDRVNKQSENGMMFTNHKNVQAVVLDDFKSLKVIGRGSFGKVTLVEYKPTGEIYAMKALKKDILIEQEQIENTLLEKEILQSINHPFLCGLVFGFQTEERIYFVMPFLSGGELFQHLKKFRTFDEEKVRFYGSQIALALDYLHSRGIVYRDIKPENILMDELGYLRLADFGMSKKLSENEKAMSFCGTPEYLAPEIITGEGHDKSADWWSFGILIYEMLCGIPPFYLDNVEKMYDLIQTGPIRFPKKIPISSDAQDLITKFLDRNVKTRLGSRKGIEEIKAHPFFATLDFNKIIEKKIPAPFIPTIKDKMDVDNFDEEFINEEVGVTYIPKKSLDMIKQNQKKFSEFN